MTFPTRVVLLAGRKAQVWVSVRFQVRAQPPRVPEEREGAVLIPPLSPPGVTVGPHCGADVLLCSITCGVPVAQGSEAGHVLLECGQRLVTATEILQAILLCM